MNGNLTIVLAAMALATHAARADLGDQLFELLPNDGAPEDTFGLSVGISGNIAIVGAYHTDDNGERSGSAYLFDATTGQQLFKLLPIDGAARDHFGRAVAISGNAVIVGARRDSDNGDQSGSAYVFDATTGQQLFKLLPDDGAEGDLFGTAVAISGNIAIIGAHQDDDNGTLSGSAYLFDVTTGMQLAKLLPDDGAERDRFGAAVAISGNTAIIGAWQDDDNGDGSGSAYLFDVTTGKQLFKLLPNDGALEDFFGAKVEINADTAVIGAPGKDVVDGITGAAYLFDATNGQQIARLMPSDGANLSEFGAAVAIGAASAIVGTSRDSDSDAKGSAYVFDIQTGRQIAKLLPDDGADRDIFGGSQVAISADIVIVGALDHEHNGIDSGSAYLFDVGRSCPADIDGDGDLDSKDFFAYLELFVAGDDRADIDGDGDIDAEDFFGYLDLFVQGC